MFFFAVRSTSQFCTELISNNAAAALNIPIALSMARELKVSVASFVLRVFSLLKDGEWFCGQPVVLSTPVSHLTPLFALLTFKAFAAFLSFFLSWFFVSGRGCPSNATDRHKNRILLLREKTWLRFRQPRSRHD